MKSFTKCISFVSLTLLSIGFMEGCSRELDHFPNSQIQSTPQSSLDSNKQASLQKIQSEINSYQIAYGTLSFHKQIHERNKEIVNISSPLDQNDPMRPKAAKATALISEFRGLVASALNFLKQLKINRTPPEYSLVKNLILGSEPLIQAMVDSALSIIDKYPGLHAESLRKNIRAFFMNFPRLATTALDVFVEFYLSFSPQDFDEIGKLIDSLLLVLENYVDLFVGHLTPTDILNATSEK